MRRADYASSAIYGFLAVIAGLPALLAIMGGFVVPAFCFSIWAIAFGWASWDAAGGGDNG